MKRRRVRWDRVAIIVATPILIGCSVKNGFVKPINSETTENYGFVEPIVLEEQTHYRSLGEFKVTYFCGGSCCNSEKYAGMAANGQKLEVGMCAADKSIPFGTELYLNTDGMMECYTVTDRGSAIKGNHIDIYVPDHNLANELGVVYTEVFVKE